MPGLTRPSMRPTTSGNDPAKEAGGHGRRSSTVPPPEIERSAQQQHSDARACLPGARFEPA